MNDIYSTFKRSFNLIEADTPELLSKVYQLRYLVLCVQNSFPDMNASDYPDGLEKDEYDEHSSHMLIQFIPTGEFIGTVRLILPQPSNPESLFPIELNTQIDPALCKLDSTIRKHSAEISRFLVSSNFDRRKTDRRKPMKEGQQPNSSTTKQASANTNSKDRRKGDRRQGDRRSALNIYMVLMAGVVRMSATHRTKYWLSAMDPALNRLLSLIGLEGEPIGPLTDYHGPRKPYFGIIHNMINKLYIRNYGAWEVITDRGKNWQLVE